MKNKPYFRFEDLKIYQKALDGGICERVDLQIFKRRNI